MDINEIKVYMKEVQDGTDNKETAWLEGFVIGLNYGGAITDEQEDELFEYIKTL